MPGFPVAVSVLVIDFGAASRPGRLMELLGEGGRTCVCGGSVIDALFVAGLSWAG